MISELFFTPPPAGVVSYFLAAGWIFAALRFSWIHRPDSREVTVIFAVLVGIVVFIPAGATIFDQLHTLFGGDSQLEAKGDVPFAATMLSLSILMVFGWGMVIDVFLILLKKRPYLLRALHLAILSFAALWTAALLTTIALGGKTDFDSHPLKTTVECLFAAGFLLAWVSTVVCGRAEKRHEDAQGRNSNERRGIAEEA